MLTRRTFLLSLAGLAGAGATAGAAVVKAAGPERGPELYAEGQNWHTHETIDNFEGTWDIDWCKSIDCRHTVTMHGTTDDGYLMHQLRRGYLSPDEFRRRKSTGDPAPSESFSPVYPLHRRRQFA